MSETARYYVEVDASGVQTGKQLIVRSFDEIVRAAQKSDQALGRNGREMDLTAARSRLLGRALGGLTAFFSARQVIDYADSWKLLEARLSLVTKANQSLAGTQQKLFDIAQSNRASIESVATLYTRVSRSADQLGVSQEQVARFTDLTTKALRIGGTSTQEAASATLQLSQALASGRLAGDEFRTTMEAAPIIADAIAKKFGVTRGELYALAKAQKITSRDIIDSLLAQGQAIDAQAGKLPLTVGQGFTVLSNSIQKFIGETDKAYGVTVRLATGLESLGKFLLANRALVETLAVALGTAGLFKSLSLIGGVLGSLGGPVLTALRALPGVVAAISGALATGAVSASAFWAALTGPIGLAVAGIGAALALFYNWRKASDAQRQSTEASAKQTLEFRNALSQLSDRDLTERIYGLRREMEALAQQSNNLAGDGAKNARDAFYATQEKVFQMEGEQRRRANEADVRRVFGGPPVTAPPKEVSDAAATARKELAKLQQQADDTLFALGNPSKFQQIQRENAKLLKDFTEQAKAAKVGTTAVTAYRKTLDSIAQGTAAAETKETSDRLAEQAENWRKNQEAIRANIQQRERLADAALRGRQALQREQEAQEDLNTAVKNAGPGLLGLVASLAQVLNLRQRLRQAEVTTATNEAVEAYQKETNALFDRARAMKTSADAVRKLAIDEEARRIANNGQVTAEIEQLARDRINAQAAITRAEQEKEQLRQIQENVTRGIQQSFSSFFEGLFTNGYKSAQDFFNNLKQLAIRTLSELASARLTQQFAGLFAAGQGGAGGNPFSIPGGQGAGKSALFGVGLAGLGVGAAVGTATSSRTKGALAGTASGAGTGAALGSIVPGLGTALGAVIGGITGFIGGMLTGGKSAENAARLMKDAQRAFAVSMLAFTAVATGTSSAVAQALTDSQAQVEQLRKQANDALGGKKNEGARNAKLGEIDALGRTNAERIKADFARSIDEQITALKPFGEALNARAKIERDYAENLRSAAAAGQDAAKVTELYELQLKALADQERRALEDLSVRALAATQGSDAADEERFRLEQQRELAAATSDATKAEIERVQALERAARAAEKAKQQIAQQADLEARLLDARGQSEAAEQLRQRLADEQLLAEARRLGNEALAQTVIAEEAAARARARAQEQANQATDLRIRLLEARGESDAAEQARRAFENEQLLVEARRLGNEELAKTVIAEEEAARARQKLRDAEVQRGDLTARLLTARGQDDAAEAARIAYENERLLTEARALGNEELAKTVIAEEAVARARARAREVAAQQADLEARLLEARGDSAAAAALRQRIADEELLDRARKFGLETLAQQVIAEEKLARARQKMIDLARASEDLEVRNLRARGMAQEADREERRIRAQREIDDAIAKFGADSAYVQRLRETQKLEEQRAAMEAVFAASGGGGLGGSGGTSSSIQNSTIEQADRMIDLLSELVALVRDGRGLTTATTTSVFAGRSSEDLAANTRTQQRLSGNVRLDLT